MKPYVLGFTVGVILSAMLCVVPRHMDGLMDGSYERMTSPPTVVQWTEMPDIQDFDGPGWYRVPDRPLPPLPRFKSSPPLYNWQLPCP